MQISGLKNLKKKRGSTIVEAVVAMTIFSIISYGSLVRLTDLARSDYSNTLNDKRRSVVNELYSYLAAEKWTKGTFDFTSMIAEGVGNGADCVNDWNSNGTVDPIDNTCIAIPYRNGSGSIAFHKADGLIAVDSSITPITASPTILATSPYLPWAYMAEFGYGSTELPYVVLTRNPSDFDRYDGYIGIKSVSTGKDIMKEAITIK